MEPDPEIDYLNDNYFAASFALAFAASQFDFDSDTQPWPLQLFMPLQLFLEDLHSEVPLQEFTPVQCMVAVSAATDTEANPEVNSIAAAACHRSTRYSIELHI